MQAPDIRAKVGDHTLAAVVLALLLTIAVAVAALAVTDRLPGVSTAADQPAAVQAPSHAMSADIEFVEINTFLPSLSSDGATVEGIQFLEENLMPATYAPAAVLSVSEIQFAEQNTFLPAVALERITASEINFIEDNTILPAVASDNPARVTTEEIQFFEDNTFSYSGSAHNLPTSSDPKRVDY
jgi:hypothetical protein